MDLIPDKLQKKLQHRQNDGSLRKLPQSRKLIDFVSNDYLGLSRSKVLFDKINAYSYQDVINLNGSTGSRLLAGNSEIVEKLESKLAKIFDAQATLLFNSGYVANLALLSSIPQRGDTIVYDSLSHVCLKEGAQLSLAKAFSFRHNDCNDLEKKLKSAEGEKYVVIESVYSMDGDMAPFDDIIAVCKQYGARIIIDEAHGTGLYGTQGAGKVCELDIHEDFFARVYTFGKAMGVHGACIAGSQDLINYLINFARPFIYTTALPAHSLVAIEAAFDYLNDHIELQNKSRSIVDYFNQYFHEALTPKGIEKIHSHTPIQPIIIPGNDKVKELADVIQNKGYDIRPILSPTVKEGSERLRVCLHTYNTREEIKDLIDQLSSRL